jgi:argininosuccinate synthase
MWKLTVHPLKVLDTPEDFTLVFKNGLPVESITAEGRKFTNAVALFLECNNIARRHDVGRDRHRGEQVHWL